MIKKKNLFLIITLIIFELLILFNSKVLINSTKDALNLFINKLFISLFPFFVLNKILINYNLQGYLSKLKLNIINKTLNISNNDLTIIILSLLSGMPSNAEYIKDALNNKIINIKEAERILLISFFPSPVFVITVIGYLNFNSIKIGIILLLIVYLSNFILGIITRNKYKVNKKNIIPENIINNKFMVVLKDSIISSINSLIIILGNLVIFSIILGIINNYLNLNIIQNSILSSLLELTNATKKVSFITNFNIKFSLNLFALIFSGFSILSQASSILSEYNINFKKIILYKLITASVISFVSLILLNFLNHLCLLYSLF